MKKRIYIFTSFTLLLSIQVIAQSKSTPASNCKRCDIPTVAEIDSDIDTPSPEVLMSFLCGFHKSCNTAAEYSEYSNEVLFKLLKRHPDKIIEALNNNKQLEADYIYSVIEFPVADFDLKSILKQVSDSKGDASVKKRIIHSLEIALQKENP